MNVNLVSPETMYYPDQATTPEHADAECDWCDSRNNVSYHAKMRRNLCEDCWDEAEREVQAEDL